MALVPQPLPSPQPGRPPTPRPCAGWVLLPAVGEDPHGAGLAGPDRGSGHCADARGAPGRMTLKLIFSRSPPLPRSCCSLSEPRGRKPSEGLCRLGS